MEGGKLRSLKTDLGLAYGRRKHQRKFTGDRRKEARPGGKGISVGLVLTLRPQPVSLQV